MTPSPRMAPASKEPGPEKRTLRKLWIGIALLALLSPIGIVVPAWLRSGAAWGEWTSEELRAVTGYVPRGLQRLQDTWRSLLPGYSVPGLGGPIGYVISAIVGIAIVVALTWLIGRALAAKERDDK